MPTVTFTSGNDSYDANAAGTYTLNFLAGDDVLRVLHSGAIVSAFLGEGNDNVTLRYGDSTVYGESGADRFEIYASGGTVDGGGDNDLFNIRGGSSQSLSGGLGDDRFNFYASAASITLHGGDGNDDFFGYNQTIGGSLYGDGGNDTFTEFRTGVTLYGGTGNDVYRLAVTSPAAFVELVGEGTDTIQVARGQSYILPDNIENISVQTFTGATSGSATLQGNALNNTINGHANAEYLFGHAGNDSLFGAGGIDSIYGGAGNDRVDGGTGDDYLFGEDGNDTINGRAGNDYMVGGTGDDTYYVDSLSDSVVEASAEGTDTVRVSVSGHTLAANVEKGIVFGSAGLALTGNSLDNVIQGGSGGDWLGGAGGNDTLKGGAGSDSLFDTAGNDVLDGGANADYMAGGLGDDVYYVDDVSDIVSEAAGEGTDTVRVSVSGLSDYSLPSEIENGVLVSAGTWFWGNALDNGLTGTSSSDMVLAGDGDDTVMGGGGGDSLYGQNDYDTLWGEAGDDYLDGGDWYDVLRGGDGNDSLVGGSHSDELYGGAGVDTFIYTSVTDSAAPYSYDIIKDFEGDGFDYLDVSNIDANTGVEGDQGFNFVLSSTGAAAEFWIVELSDGKMLYFDVDGGGADMAIAIQMASGTYIYGMW